ncbi:multimerin-2 isoform X1 [Dasypus novemcinctus]|uniref:multimerin-2 isoform X1 n=1 Tax=Dasypus novemcinctus TaxID=9361 RepID=UPI000328812E|nr:multimerin-2 isoform X1 [Dasypus novemcinctus]
MLLTLLLGLGGPLAWGLPGAWAQVPRAGFSDPPSPRGPEEWREETEDPSRGPGRRNWCPYQTSKLVTFVAACRAEKFLVHSQQPCPQGAPDCQQVRVLYHTAHRPVYQVRQKVLASVAWRCCPGYAGADCQDHDPTATPEPAGPGEVPGAPVHGPAGFGLGEELSWAGPAAAETVRAQAQQERLLGELQNDVRQAAGSLPSLREALARNLTAAAELPGRSSEQVPLPQVDAFLQVHLSPIWSSFNKSLHSLAQAVRNLSRDVEANRRAIERGQGGAACGADVQKPGAKRESKVQEDARRVGQLQRDLDDCRHGWRPPPPPQTFSEVQADEDPESEPLPKAPELESLQAWLGHLQNNFSALQVAVGRREEEVHDALGGVRAAVAQHGQELKQLFTLSEDASLRLGKAERQLDKLRVDQGALRELRAVLTERSLAMEENKEEVERRLLGLSLTLQQVQGAQASLLPHVRNCSRALSQARAALDERRGLDKPSPQALRKALETLAESVEALRGQGAQAQAELALLGGRVRALARGVAELQRARDAAQRDARQLHSSFAALLEDTLRHEAVLAALFGDEALEELGEAALGPQPPSLEQTRAALWAAGPGAAADRELEGLRGAAASVQQALERHVRLFHGLFGNFQGLLAANVSLDLEKLQALLSRRERRQQGGLEAARRRDRKRGAPWADSGGKASAVAFYASLAAGTAAPQTVKFNTTLLNAGSSYFPEHGYFQAPERGVYFFAVSVEFGPGPGAGQLVFGGRHRTPVHATEEQATTFAVAQLQKDERVWFELTQGTVTKRNPPGATFGGFLISRT